MNRTIRFAIALLMTLGIVSCQKQAPLAGCVTPRPQHVEQLRGELNLGRPLHVVIEAPGAERLAASLAETRLPLADDAATEGKARLPELRLACSDDKALPASEEGYRMKISRRGIEILSRGEAGLFYGIQTLRQIHDQYGDRLPALEITD